MKNKETEQRTQLMKELRKQGLSYRAIGLRLGVSRQTVFNHIGGYERVCYFTPWTEQDIAYKGLREYMNEHRMSKTDFTRLIYGQPFNPNNFQRLSKILAGGENFTKPTIDKILSATGLTYEEAFRKEV